MNLNVSLPDELVQAIAAQVAAELSEAVPVGPEPYLTVDQAAEYLACPKSRVYELKKQGRIAHYRDGTRLLFTREDLDAALDRIEP